MERKQESVSDWMALAKAYDKAEREQGVEHYVIVIIRNERTGEELYRYDIPREMFFRRKWVINWRVARLLCKYPKDGVRHDLFFYDKKTGLETGIGSLISSLTSAKANITMTTNRLQEYIAWKKGDMFFDEASDEVVLKLKAKILQYQQKASQLEEQIKEKVQKIQTNRLTE